MLTLFLSQASDSCPPIPRIRKSAIQEPPSARSQGPRISRELLQAAAAFSPRPEGFQGRRGRARGTQPCQAEARQGAVDSQD